MSRRGTASPFVRSFDFSKVRSMICGTKPGEGLVPLSLGFLTSDIFQGIGSLHGGRSWSLPMTCPARDGRTVINFCILAEATSLIRINWLPNLLLTVFEGMASVSDHRAWLQKLWKAPAVSVEIRSEPSCVAECDGHAAWQRATRH